MRLATLLLLLASTAAHADVAPTRSTTMSPAVGVETSATAGTVVFERATGTWAPAVMIKTGTEITGWGSISVVAGQTLQVVRDDKGIVACDSTDLTGALCLRDKEGDGVFEVKAMGAYPTFWLKMKQPVAYAKVPPISVPDAAGAFRQALSYMGVSGNTLRLSYREFVNDMARPAFTEEVTFNLSGKYPETVAYKDVSIDVLGVDNAGLRYIVRKTGN